MVLLQTVLMSCLWKAGIARSETRTKVSAEKSKVSAKRRTAKTVSRDVAPTLDVIMQCLSAFGQWAVSIGKSYFVGEASGFILASPLGAVGGGLQGCLDSGR
jgi:hypothetical protein